MAFSSLHCLMSRSPIATWQDPYRESLPDNGSIHFSHADLNLANIMILSECGRITISGIIDWDQSGWYPNYWEYCKMVVTTDYEHEWRSAGWIERIIEERTDELAVLQEYMHWRGMG